MKTREEGVARRSAARLPALRCREGRGSPFQGIFLYHGENGERGGRICGCPHPRHLLAEGGLITFPPGAVVSGPLGPSSSQSPVSPLLSQISALGNWKHM